MDWIVIARKLGEADDVLIFDRLANGRTHADREIFEIKRLKQRILHAQPEPAKTGARPTPPTMSSRELVRNPERPRAEAREWRRPAIPRFRHTTAAARSDRPASPASPCARTGECLR